MADRHAARRRAVIVGSGVAGLTAALELGRCTLVTRGELGGGASRWAQGGIAAAVDPQDHPTAHAADTHTASGGLTEAAVVEMITAAAPERIDWLATLGAELDRDAAGRLLLGREAGHGARRIVRGGGDATGAVVMRALVAAIRARDDIQVVEHTRAIDLVRCGGRVAGVSVARRHGDVEVLFAAAVVLATGGIGQVFARTTNPAEATGDGLAMAWRAGAVIRDPEFVQFHPTALDADLDPLPLLTEALRGEGAHLIDATGHRYALDAHPDGELAPRDVVARANWEAQRSGPIHLDARHLGEGLPTRFPTVFAACRSVGIDPRDTPIPVTPAQHYHMGGISTDDHGRSSLAGLYACGETAAVGLHGANRLASNSLLEGLVMGARVADAIRRAPADRAAPRAGALPSDAPPVTAVDDDMALAELRNTMWRHGGLVRDEAGLTSALATIDRLTPALTRSLTGRNLVTCAGLVLRAALQRHESRGSHHRVDRPETLPGAGTPTLLQRSPTPVPAPLTRVVAS